MVFYKKKLQKNIERALLAARWSGWSAVFEMVFVQNLFVPFCMFLIKTLYGTFPCLVVLASSCKFQSYFYKTIKPK